MNNGSGLGQMTWLWPVALVFLAGCSVPDSPTDVHDPYEQVNRAIHSFNKGLDTVAVRPASRFYGELLPGQVRTSVDNVANNLTMPTAIINKALQGEGEDAIHNGFRLLLNTTLGVLGLFDVAESFGIEERSADFGTTLAGWGAAEGAYIELPLLGPSSERAAIGQVVDILTNPLGLFSNSEDVRNVDFAAQVGLILNQRYTFGTTFDGILYDSADSYAQLRLFYLENRRFNDAGGQTDAIDTEFYDDLYGDLYDE